VHALGYLRELQGISEENQVAGGRAHGQRIRERDLAGLVDHQVVQRTVQLGAREEPRRPREELNIRGGIRERGVVRIAPEEVAVELGFGIAGRRLLEPLEANAGVPGHPLDLGQEIVDGLVALRRDADAPTGGEEVHDDPRACPCLAGSWRTLEEEVAPVQPERVGFHFGEIDGLDPAPAERPRTVGRSRARIARSAG